MPTEVAPKPAVKRGRFQFSLRMLIATVLVYAALWLLTIKVGGPSLAHAYASFYRNELVTLSSNDKIALEISPNPKPRHQIFPKALRGVMYAPAPFVVIWNWERKMGAEAEWQAVPECGAIHFWFPGCEATIGKQIPKFEDYSVILY